MSETTTIWSLEPDWIVLVNYIVDINLYYKFNIKIEGVSKKTVLECYRRVHLGYNNSCDIFYNDDATLIIKALEDRAAKKLPPSSKG